MAKHKNKMLECVCINGFNGEYCQRGNNVSSISSVCKLTGMS